MSALAVPQKASKPVTQEVKRLRSKVKFPQIRLIDFCLGALLMLRAVALPGGFVGLPVSELAAAALAALALLRGPATRRLAAPPLFLLVLFGVATVDLGVVSFLAGTPFIQRLGRLVYLGLFAWGIAYGRLHLRSVVMGLTAGIVTNALLFSIGIGPDEYGGYLTGFLGDKNYAGMIISAVALLLCSHVTQRKGRLAVLVIFGLLLWWTGSRTSMFACFMGIMWVIVTLRRSLSFRVLLLPVAWLLFEFVEANYARVGVFIDRLGSDALRDRIDAASYAKTLEAMPWGAGAGQGYVVIQDGLRFFFHNSYETLLVEGGVILCSAICLIVLVVFLGGRHHFLRPIYVRYAEGAVLCLSGCAFSLGEVHVTGIFALSIGAIIFLRTRALWEASSSLRPAVVDSNKSEKPLADVGCHD